MKNYIDVKVTVWNRIHFTDDTDMSKLLNDIEQGGMEEVTAEARGFVENETLYDTEERLMPEDNGKASTIEVYQDEKLIWENGENIL